jgi:hypothetical protein
VIQISNFLKTAMTIFYSFVVLFIIVVIVNTIYSAIYKIVNVPTTPFSRNALVEDIRSLKGNCEGLVIYDLGAGWGGLCLWLARAFPKAKITGYEVSPFPYLVARIRQLISFKKNYRICYGDLFKKDISDADIIFAYLSPQHMTRLSPSISKGTIVYSQGFEMPGKTPEKVISVRISIERNLYRYRF